MTIEIKSKEELALRNHAILKIGKAYPKKGLAWAIQQLDRALANTDLEPLNEELYNMILKEEFGIESKEERKARLHEANQKFIKEFDDNHGQFIMNLKERWDDEKEYEDWEDYALVIRKRFAGVYNVIKILKVGVRILIDDIEFTVKGQKFGLKYEAKLVKGGAK